MPSGTVLREIIGLCCRTGLSAVFISCRVAALQSCQTSRLGPPSPIGDLGLFWAIPPLGWVRNRSSSANELGSGYFQENFPVRVAPGLRLNHRKRETLCPRSDLFRGWIVGSSRFRWVSGSHSLSLLVSVHVLLLPREAFWDGVERPYPGSLPLNLLSILQLPPSECHSPSQIERG